MLELISAITGVAQPSPAVPVATWIQLCQAIVALINLTVVVYVFKTTRRDKQNELRMGVDSFWLQKVIVEPYSKQIDELISQLEALLRKCRSESSSFLTTAPSPGKLDESVSSYADVASQHVEKLRLALVPLLTIVVDGNCRGSPPSKEIDDELDKIDEATTRGIAKLFDDPAHFGSETEDMLRDGRLALMKVLFLMHKRPFEIRR